MTFALAVVFYTVTYISTQMLIPDLAHSAGHSRQKATSLMSFIGVCSMIGRISTGVLYDRSVIRPHRAKLYNAAMTIIASACLTLTFVRSYAGLAVICALFGVVNGGVISQRAVVSSDFVGVHRLGSVFSLTVFLQGAGLFIGPSIAGKRYAHCPWGPARDR